MVDRRRAFGRDRTWALWAVRPHAFDGAPRRRWERWDVVTDRAAAAHRSRAYPYVAYDSRDVYAHALARLEDDPASELRLGTTVLGMEPLADPPRVRTDAGEWSGGRVYDALGLGSPALRGRPAGRTTLAQAFLGWDVEVDRPVFDPAQATLMDFRLPQDAGLRFLYVLPTSRTRALVEDTTVAPGGVPAEQRRATLERWLGERAGEWAVHHEERGRVLMTDAPFPANHGPRVHAVGTAAGAVRPSSGYAFARLQRHCRELARAVAAGAPPPVRVGDRRAAALDRVFLEALHRDPGSFPERFRLLVARTTAEAFARFMTDASSPADELQVIAAMPKVPFVAAAARVLAG